MRASFPIWDESEAFHDILDIKKKKKLSKLIDQEVIFSFYSKRVTKKGRGGNRIGFRATWSKYRFIWTLPG